MVLRNGLNQVVDFYISEIGHINDFLKSIEQELTKKQRHMRAKMFKTGEKKQIENFCEALSIALKEKGDKTDSSKKLSIRLSENVSKFVVGLVISFKQKQFLAEMCLVYLISYFEAFIKDYFIVLYTQKKEMLKSKVKLSYEQVVDASSIESLIYVMATKEVEGIGYGSIDDIAEYINKKLNINLYNFEKWESVREMIYRRNILIHNKGLTNDIYCEKTGYPYRNKQLKPDYKYVSEAIDIIILFINFFHNKIVQKLEKSEDKITGN